MIWKVNKIKKKIKSIFILLVCSFLLSWCIAIGLDVWLKCAILDTNKSNAYTDIHSGVLKEVSTVYDNGDFIIKGVDDFYTLDDITGYIRVPAGMRYYYNLETKSFVAPLTMVESRNIISQFGMLDLVCYVVFLVMLILKQKSKLYIRIIMYSLFTIGIILSELTFTNALNVLYGVENSFGYILLGKLTILSLVFVIKNIVVYKRSRTK